MNDFSQNNKDQCPFWIMKNCDLWYCGLKKDHDGNHIIAIPRFNVEKVITES